MSSPIDLKLKQISPNTMKEKVKELVEEGKQQLSPRGNNIITSSSSSSSSVFYTVNLNVYGLTELNAKLAAHNIGGIYHVGVLVHGNEWSYGYHRYSISGIYTLHKPGDLKSLSRNENMFYFVDSITVGTTNQAVDKFVTYVSVYVWR